MSDTDFDRLAESHARRRLFRFDPTFNSGHIAQIFVIVAGMFTGYTALKEGQATQRVELDQVKANAAAESLRVKESITEVRTDVKEVQRTLNDMNQTLAAIKAQQPIKGKP